MRKRVEVSAEESGFLRKVGSRAGFGLAAVGLVFAAYQVQGWTMPRLLAAFLIVLLLAVVAVAVLSIAWETIREVMRWRERRETSTAWIAAEPPGQLDLIPDMERATKKFVRQMKRLNRDTGRLGKKIGRYSRLMNWARRFGPRAVLTLANQAAKANSRSAAFIEKRATHLRKTVDELRRTQEGQLTRLSDPETDEDWAALSEAQAVAASRTVTTAETIESVVGYRDAVLGIAHQDLARTLTASSKQLAAQLEAVIVILRRSLKDSERAEALLKQKAIS
jgi:hypothetical protein